ncbi:MAG TPA: aminotransferase class V-fold PLP-dependent enzyme [Terrimicrobiaceae bacterium]|nr:aminotransferase class V-fold PLP-dependent enzyme [Terrimicrobiaceae bacterium]
MSVFTSEAERLERFPVAKSQIFVAHAGVTPLPKCAAEAMISYIRASCEDHQEFGEVLRDIDATRKLGADLIGADKSEIALLGPTSLGLSLFANGITWREGDEVVCYPDDYPSNVYPWTALTSQGVKIRQLRPERPGHITPELVKRELSSRTRLVALASCHYLSGWRIDVDAIGESLHKRGVLFSVDAIQTLGAFPFSAKFVDFLSADAHKWMLGPMAIGIVYVARQHFELCRPTLLGSWNIHSPQFLAQETMKFHETAQRYEPGVLNVAGVYGMKASLEMIEATGLGTISATILDVRDHLHGLLEQMGFEFLSPPRDEPLRSGIVTARHPRVAPSALFSVLEKEKITASLRMARECGEWLRFSPHFYNTRAEMERIADVLQGALRA